MSKVGESVIQGAIEALEIAQRNDRNAEAKIPASPNLPETTKPAIKRTERHNIKKN